MDQQGVKMDWETFDCSMCEGLPRDAVTIPCGHSYCRRCIETYWDGQNIHSCPQCGQTFTPRPVLVRNTMLAAVVEELRKTNPQAAPADRCYAGPADVGCDVCSGSKLKAIKSCLQCLASYCQQHLQPHYDSPTFKKHKLVHPSQRLQENICPLHDEVMKMFCRTDQQCVCYLCSVEEHRGHDTVSAAAERAERQRELQENRDKVQQRIKDTEKELKLLQKKVKDIGPSADQAVRDSEEMFTYLIRLMEKRRSDVEQQIRSQQKTEVSRSEELLKKLEREIIELRTKDAELQQLSHTKDHIQFLQEFTALSNPREASASVCINVCPLRYFEEVAAAVSKVKDQLKDILSEGWMKISDTLINEGVPLSAVEPKTREEFLRCSQQITMDPNTAHSWLSMSEGNRKVTLMREEQSFSDHPDRFISRFQVLSRETLTGRCYWEVELSGIVQIAVSYKDIDRDGKKSRFGYNDKSYALCCSNQNDFTHNSVKTSLLVFRFSKVGVYLDHSAGLLSFYSISDSMTLLHRVQTTFTQPLHAGLWLYEFGSTAEFK